MKGPLTAKAWNAMLDALALLLRNRIMSVTTIGGGKWLHPWHTSAKWNATKERWEATINPGFVNGLDVTVNIERSTLNVEQLNQLPASMLDVQSSMLDVPLTSSPLIPLTSTRHITTGVPDFFAALGVRSETLITEDQIDQGITEVVSGLPSDSASERQLRACDIVLRCARPRTTVDWSFGTQPEATLAQFQVGSVVPASAGRFTLRGTAEFTSVAVDDTDLLTGSVSDPGYDEQKVCTVFFLSQPGAASDAELDETWTPHVRHDLFWNADYLITAPVAGTPAQNIEVNLAGLGNAAGAQINVNQLLATNNDAFAAALQFLTARVASGQITTPGHRVAPEWDKTTSLNPPFPFIGLPL